MMMVREEMQEGMQEEMQEGMLFQKYEMIAPLGGGTQGQVFLARDRHLDRLAAIKICDAKESGGEREAEAGWEKQPDDQMVREARLLKELEHPCLPAVYDFWQDGGKSCLAMEYVDGITLRAYLKKNRTVPAEQAVQWAVQLCGVLSYLHGRGQELVYRDLKPENIMIRPDGSIKLIDLGGTLCYRDSLHGRGTLAGTPGYCPHEQWKEKRGDLTWDIYSLGVVLHEMLTGIHPSGMSGALLPIRGYDKSLPDGLERIVAVCTAPQKENRYQSMEQLKEALLHYKQEGIRGRIWWKAKKVLVYGLFGTAFGTLVIPLFRGIPENEIPFPFLVKPILLTLTAAGLNFLLLRGRRLGKDFIKQEKNVRLTEKKFLGLYLLFFFLLGCAFGETAVQTRSLCFGGIGQEMSAYAGEKEEKLWVEMRDDEGRKMLLKDGAVYVPKECVRFEIPLKSLPEETIRLQMAAEGEGGNLYVSRVFLIGREEGEAGVSEDY
ncbi:MAG: serine/threonine protein kinase [Lachnospiraceae bacterium]|nr:serine/threonine protein kinase [Lachnospiraceae bacterium]